MLFPPPNNAQSDILEFLTEQIGNGHSCISYLDIAVETRYALSTVQLAIRRLEHLRCIRVQPGRPNRYELIPEQERIALLFAHTEGAYAPLSSPASPP